MRLVILCLAFALISCETGNADISSIPTTPASKIDTDEANIIDTIFLGYRFGMSENQFRAHTKNLLKEGVLYQDDKTNLLTYDMVDDSRTVFPTVYSPGYFRGGMSTLSLSVKCRSSYMNNPVIVTSSIGLMLMEKYRSPSTETKSAICEGSKNYEWLKGNLHVDLICGFDDARIIYSDLRSKALQDSISEEATKATIDNL
jgi:hypothetical protein